MMVGYECSFCGGSGKEVVTEIRNGNIKQFTEGCTHCMGSGSFTNGMPDNG